MAPLSHPVGSGEKRRHLEVVVYDPARAAAAAAAKRHKKKDPPAVILDVAPINAVPLPPRLLLLPPPPAAGREEHPCLRKHFLVGLGFRADLPLHYIDEKRVSRTDLEGQQNRFRIPTDGVAGRLRAILTAEELHEANLLHDPPPRTRSKKKLRKQQQPDPAPAEAEPQDGGAEGDPRHRGEAAAAAAAKEPRKQGKPHRGLDVRLVDLEAGASGDLQMARWDSSQATVVKGAGYLEFIRRCGFGQDDVVEVWAFVQRRFRLFGEDVCKDSPLHVLIVKKEQQQQPECRYCMPIPPPAPQVDPPIIDAIGVAA